MATLHELRRRVRSVKNIRQITRAMKMVAAAKLRRTQDRILAARPYSDKIWDVINETAIRTEARDHPLLQQRREGHITAVVISSDRGLCGSFNSNVMRRTHAALDSWEDRAVQLVTIGKAGYNHFRERQWHIAHNYADLLGELDFADAARVARRLTVRFTDEETDAVYLIYNEFKSVLQQKVVVEPLLPLHGLAFEHEEGVTARQAARAFAESRAGGEALTGVEEIRGIGVDWGELQEEAEEEAREAARETQEMIDYLYEPSAERIFTDLLPRHVETQVYRALLESLSAEHAARMTAMDNATQNADEMIDDLTLTMNKARQEEITTEILEVVGGAEALE